MLDKTFIGKRVLIILDCGEKTEGVVNAVSDNFFWLDAGDSFDLIMPDKISLLRVFKNTISHNKERASYPTQPSPSYKASEVPPTNPLHSGIESYNNFPFSTPTSNNDSDEDFGVFFGTAKANKISFNLKEESKGEE